MPARKIILILLVAWLACQVLAWVHPYMTEPVGRGVANGITMVLLFMTWQSVAVLVSVGLLAVRLMRAQELTPAQKWLGQGPIMLQALGTVVLVLFFNFTI